MLKSCSQRYVVMILIFFELINCLSNNINKLSLSIDEKWDSMLHGDLWELHQLLTFNYQNSNMEYDETRKEAIKQYRKSLSTSKMIFIVTKELILLLISLM